MYTEFKAGRPMDVFDLDGRMLEDYQRFARSFTQIRAKDIQAGVIESTPATTSGRTR